MERLYADLIRRVDVTRKDFEGYRAALEEKISRHCDTYEEDCQLYHDTSILWVNYLNMGNVLICVLVKF